MPLENENSWRGRNKEANLMSDLLVNRRSKYMVVE